MHSFRPDFGSRLGSLLVYPGVGLDNETNARARSALSITPGQRHIAALDIRDEGDSNYGKLWARVKE